MGRSLGMGLRWGWFGSGTRWIAAYTCLLYALHFGVRQMKRKKAWSGQTNRMVCCTWHSLYLSVCCARDNLPLVALHAQHSGVILVRNEPSGGHMTIHHYSPPTSVQTRSLMHMFGETSVRAFHGHTGATPKWMVLQWYVCIYKCCVCI